MFGVGARRDVVRCLLVLRFAIALLAGESGNADLRIRLRRLQRTLRTHRPQSKRASHVPEMREPQAHDSIVRIRRARQWSEIFGQPVRLDGRRGLLRRWRLRLPRRPSVPRFSARTTRNHFLRAISRFLTLGDTSTFTVNFGSAIAPPAVTVSGNTPAQIGNS